MMLGARALAIAGRAQVRGAATEAAERQAVGRSTYAALESRLNLQFGDRGLMERVCTHRSAAGSGEASNERLQWVGKRVLNLQVGEHLERTYPNMTVEMLQDVQHGSFGLSSLAEVGRHFGMQPALRWRSTVKEEPGVGATKVLGKAVQALVGAIYKDRGPAAARDFVRRHILSRPVDTETVLQIKNPRVLLAQLMQRKGMERPVARILKETGRFTSSPVFIVGVFSGVKMVGMGFGSSLRMAEHRAAKDALIKYYAKEIKDLPPASDQDAAEEAELSFFEAKDRERAQA
ncbi:54S ribosomal protein L3 mitochondrial [Coemansia javaensis]|uniref:Large ribosomal subunit protein mL44 n=1 Tax=Coemansia javaensis TaxID=2761396 RepID=A0A9W8LHE2_9FUNG|nr:54S ribosomal protein L3 mitochondrial [Coemansia javaensis]